MRFVLCDEDQLLRSMVETILERQGHEVIGVADHTAVATQLVKVGKPDAVIVDLSLGYNTDFDIIDTAIEVGAAVIVFSHNADHLVLGRYSPPPLVVSKPDLQSLERVTAKVFQDTEEPVASSAERRRRPTRAAIGPQPTGVSDAQAFYEALGNAADGDALLSIEGFDDAEVVAKLVRGTDRVLDTGSKLLVFLAGGGVDAISAFLSRMHEEATGGSVRSIVVAADESGHDAFSRLKAG